MLTLAKTTPEREWQFRRKHARQPIRLTRNGFALHGARLYVAKIGELKVKWSRELTAQTNAGLPSGSRLR